MATFADAELFLSAMVQIRRTINPLLKPTDSGFIYCDFLWPLPSSPTSISTRSASPATSTSSTSSTSSLHHMTTRSRAKAEVPVIMQKAPTGKRSEQERIDVLKRDSLIAGIGPHEVWCLGCDAFVALDSSRMYSVHHWQQHKELYHVPGGKMYEREQLLRKQIGKDVKLFNSRRRPQSKKHLEIYRKLQRTNRR